MEVPVEVMKLAALVFSPLDSPVREMRFILG